MKTSDMNELTSKGLTDERLFGFAYTEVKTE